MQIKQTIHQNLHQLAQILHQLSDKDYTQPLEILNGQTIGKHVRHIVEFYQCLVESDLTISYDERKRNILLETSTDYAISIIELIINKIDNLAFNQVVILKQLVNDEIFHVNTTIGRELIYCIDHNIHHLAIIKIALDANFPTIILPKDFGIAYSTIKFNANKQ